MKSFLFAALFISSSAVAGWRQWLGWTPNCNDRLSVDTVQGHTPPWLDKKFWVGEAPPALDWLKQVGLPMNISGEWTVPPKTVLSMMNPTQYRELQRGGASRNLVATWGARQFWIPKSAEFDRNRWLEIEELNSDDEHMLAELLNSPQKVALQIRLSNAERVVAASARVDALAHGLGITHTWLQQEIAKLWPSFF